MATATMSQDQKAKLPISAHLLCGWPLALVAVGGAIGGGLGGAAYAINLAVYKSEMPTPAKVLLNLAIGGAAVVGWLVLGALLLSAFK